MSEYVMYPPAEKCHTCGEGCCCRASEFQYLLFHASQLGLNGGGSSLEEVERNIDRLGGEVYDACIDVDLYKGVVKTTPVVGIPMVPDEVNGGYVCPHFTESGCSRPEDYKPAICCAVDPATCRVSDEDYGKIIDSWSQMPDDTKIRLELVRDKQQYTKITTPKQ